MEILKNLQFIVVTEWKKYRSRNGIDAESSNMQANKDELPL